MKLDLEKLAKQEYIHLSNKRLHDDDLDVLYKVIEQSTVIETLRLDRNRLTLSDGKLANAIGNSETIKVLHLRHNNIGPEGIKLLAAIRWRIGRCDCKEHNYQSSRSIQ